MNSTVRTSILVVDRVWAFFVGFFFLPLRFVAVSLQRQQEAVQCLAEGHLGRIKKKTAFGGYTLARLPGENL